MCAPVFCLSVLVRRESAAVMKLYAAHKISKKQKTLRVKVANEVNVAKEIVVHEIAMNRGIHSSC